MRDCNTEGDLSNVKFCVQLLSLIHLRRLWLFEQFYAKSINQAI